MGTFHCSSASEQQWIHQPSKSYLFRGDQNASYNIFPYNVDPKTEIVIKGQYPYASYFSITVIGQLNLLVGSAADSKLLPDPGSTNPFLPGANWDAKNRSYTLKIRFTAPPEGSDHFVPGAGNNIIYAGTLANGAPNLHGLLAYRLYVPSIGYDSTGGVGYPVITYCASTSERGYNADMPRQQNTSVAAGFNNTDRQSSSSQGQAYFTDYLSPGNTTPNNMNTSQDATFTQSCDLTWRTITRIAEVIHPDTNTTYITSNQIHRDPGKLLLIRWKAPTVPDTYHNIGVMGNEDMRYWSMTFVTPAGIMGLYTISDFQAIIDRKGYVNLVISFGAQRPSCVTSENGFTWADVSQLPLVPLFLDYRNNQVSENFPYTAKDVPAGQTVPPEVMGKYYPCGNYVDPMYFDARCSDMTQE